MWVYFSIFIQNNYIYTHISTYTYIYLYILSYAASNNIGFISQIKCWNKEGPHKGVYSLVSFIQTGKLINNNRSQNHNYWKSVFDWKWAKGRLLGYWSCSLFWLQWWFHGYVHFMKIHWAVNVIFLYFIQHVGFTLKANLQKSCFWKFY